MSFKPVEAGPESAAAEKLEQIRAAIERDLRPLSLAVARLVRSFERVLKRDRLAQRVEEVLSETACRALQSAASFDPTRPVLPWLIGIAQNVIRGEIRNAVSRPAMVPWDAVAWERVSKLLDPPDQAAALRIDFATMMERLSPSERRAIECRFTQGLGGRELAEALGAPSEEAARVRVFRAIQTLKRLFAAGPEVTP